MQNDDRDAPLPAYTYVPGGPWPHPKRLPTGALEQRLLRPGMTSPAHTNRGGKRKFLRGGRLFNAGYYWEAHEVWEELWHAEGRRGPTAEVLKGLIKLAAAGREGSRGARERRPHPLPPSRRVVCRGGRAGGRRANWASTWSSGPTRRVIWRKIRRGIPVLPAQPVSRVFAFRDRAPSRASPPRSE